MQSHHANNVTWDFHQSIYSCIDIGISWKKIMNHKNIISVIFTTNQPRVLIFLPMTCWFVKIRNFCFIYFLWKLVVSNSVHKCYIKVGVTLGFALNPYNILYIFFWKNIMTTALQCTEGLSVLKTWLDYCKNPVKTN